MIDQRINLLLRLISIHVLLGRGGEGGDVDQGGWSLEAIASGPRHGGIRKVRDRTSRLPSSSSSSLFLPRFTGKRRARARVCGSRGGPVPSRYLHH